MAGQNSTGIQRLKEAWDNSLAGIKPCWVREEAFRQEVMLTVLATSLAFNITEIATERALLISSLLLLLIIELINSAVEATVDRAELEYHELSGSAKGIGSTAVLFGSLLVVSTWLLIPL